MGNDKEALSHDVGRNHLTLRFKNGRTTILVSALPSDSFRAIKEELLRSLAAVGLSSLDGKDAPTNPDLIELAVPIDPLEPTRGWVPLEINEANDEDAAINGSSKNSKAKSVLNDTPKGAGLKDGAMLAFRFLDQGQTEGDPDEEWNAEVASLEHADAYRDALEAE